MDDSPSDSFSIGPKRLTAAQTARYHDCGFLVVPQVFSAEEVSDLAAECDRLWRQDVVDRKDRRVHYRDHLGGPKIADRLDPVTDISLIFKQVAAEPRLLALAASALGEEAALFKDKLITKRPGTMGYSLHQDYPYWSWTGVPADQLLTIMVSIDSSDAANGALEMFSGLHDRCLKGCEEEPRDLDPGELGQRCGHVIETAAGDVMLNHSLTPHRSGPNTSNVSRRTLLFTYTTAGHAGAYERYYQAEYQRSKRQST